MKWNENYQINKKQLNFVPVYSDKNGKISLAKTFQTIKPNQFQNVSLKKQILLLKRQLQKQKQKSKQVDVLALQIKQIKLKIAEKIKSKQEQQKKLYYQQQLKLRGLIPLDEQKSSQSQSLQSQKVSKSQRTIKKQSLVMSNSLPKTPQSQIYWNNFPLNQSKTFYDYMDQKSSQNQNSSCKMKRNSTMQAAKLKKCHSINTRLNNLKKLRQQSLNSLSQTNNN